MVILFCSAPLLYFGMVASFILWVLSVRSVNTVRPRLLQFVFIPIIIILMGVVSILSFGGGVGPGLWLIFGCFPVTLVAVGYYLLNVIKPRRIFTSRIRFRRVINHLIAIAFIALVGLSPAIGFQLTGQVCTTLNRTQAESIIKAVEAYRDDFLSYPDDIETLVPLYIEDLPKPICANPFVDHHAYEYSICEADEHTLWYTPPYLGFLARYHFETGRWSSISQLDGNCSFLSSS